MFKKRVKVGELYEDVTDWDAVAAAAFWALVALFALSTCTQ